MPVARSWTPARCRCCGMLIRSDLRSTTALWNCSSAMLKAVSAALLDRTVLEAMQRVAQDRVGLGLHLVQFVGGIAVPREREHVQQPLALRRVDAALVLLQIAREPGADRTQHGQPIRLNQM